VTSPDPLSAAALRPAATVLLLRDVGPPAGGIEVFMERRHLQSGFVGGAYVFPGGRVDPNDGIEPSRCAGVDEATANRRLGLASGGLAHYVAAIRECFEEAGVLLAYRRSGELLTFSDPATETRYQRYRNDLNEGALDLPELIEREDLVLATDLIAYWSHWITPVGEPRRYDTRFFVTHAPAGQTAAHDDWELTSSAWVTPDEAIERAARGEWLIILPTLMNLRTLSQHPTAASAVAWAAAQSLPLPANQPKIFRGQVVLPGDPGYDEGEVDVSKFDRELFERPILP
jgi:8-oxo-dGTP pyrophosphatase MutT (NUDIX family)